MEQPIIEIKNLGKEYDISHTNGRYVALRDILTNVLKSPFAFLKRKAKKIIGRESKEEFWALKDVNFKINKGEVVGIIGRNGAGKSTLLKIISQITPPSTGEAVIRGSVGSLLEVGTGFHPELTGRENIFLNGAILGMSKKEIIVKFNDIVAFSGIEKFLDTPVKFYSSGMYVRLAFSVAAHMEPDVLIIDEVLAVGDVEFQKKCLGKMDDITKKEGRTILFVSHNLDAVASLCDRAIVLDGGQIVFDGKSNDAIHFYSSSEAINRRTQWEGSAGDKDVRICKTWVRSLDRNIFHTAADIEIGMEADILNPVNDLIFGFTLFSEFNYELAYCLYDDELTTAPTTLMPGKISKKFIIPANTLAEGGYRINIDVGIHNTRRIVKEDADLFFSLYNTDGLGTRYRMQNLRGKSSLFRPKWGVNS